ncbi:MAG: ABC transporter ATP-binding protein/permease [Clostridia bacterium]|nr:ABC transporter ATP-binding protein/permease [Clostridia bacterium]
MLEVVNLTKIYSTKTSDEVKALDGVSLRFPERGMVFLLGKSGSGKSTLLNLCGGLDAPTSGEIIVKGRSSKDFSQSDFDSYRNTFVGFVFQEYNILNEFSVEDNVSLALELQGKPKDRKTVNDLLKQVDLEGYAKRKPNTLSGGQKQRIAIARALVKSPEIIMADEPTGALDSATGKQVFDTLKKLSKDKLVLVVSHDREFAEQYGDRVIELMDGKVISDVSKEKEAQTPLSENLSSVGNTLCVKNGAALTERDFAAIRTFLRATSAPAVIASGERDVTAYKTAARITENGEKEVFRNTDNAALALKTYTEKDSRFIRSRLPMRHAAKIGLSGLKYKPLRLIFTIILCTVAFTLFGLLSTMTFYNSKATFRQTLKDSNPAVVRFVKIYQSSLNEYEYGELVHTYTTTYDALFSAEEVASLAKSLNAEAFAGISYGRYIDLKTSSRYYSAELSYAAFLPEDHSLRTTLLGKYPSAKNEIAISSFMAESIIACGGYDAFGNEFNAKTPSDLVGRAVNFGEKENHIITGVFQSGALSDKYDVLKDDGNVTDENYRAIRKLETQLNTDLRDGLHELVLLSKEEIDDYFGNRVNDYYEEFQNRVVNFYDENGVETGYGIYGAITNHLTGTLFFAQDKTALAKGEAIVSAEWWVHAARILFEDCKITAENELYALDDAYIPRIVAENSAYDEWGARLLIDDWKWGNITPAEGDLLFSVYSAFMQEASPILKRAQYYGDLLEKCDLVLYQKEWLNGVWTEDYTQKRAAALSDLVAASGECPLQTIAFRTLDCHYGTPLGELQTVTVVGICDKFSHIGSKHVLLVDQTEFSALWEEQKTGSASFVDAVTAYESPAFPIGNQLFLSYNGSTAVTNAVTDAYFNKSYDENDCRMDIYSSFADRFATVDDFVKSASKVFLYVGLAFAAFAVLLLSNFISVSISYKKKEIGILRAVGARSADVFKIFFSESAFITLLCTAISTAFSLILCHVLNAEIASGLGASIFVFGALSFLFLIGIAFLTCVGATYLPVQAAARKKPVDSIRAL